MKTRKVIRVIALVAAFALVCCCFSSCGFSSIYAKNINVSSSSICVKKGEVAYVAVIADGYEIDNSGFGDNILASEDTAPEIWKETCVAVISYDESVLPKDDESADDNIYIGNKEIDVEEAQYQDVGGAYILMSNDGRTSLSAQGKEKSDLESGILISKVSEIPQEIIDFVVANKENADVEGTEYIAYIYAIEGVEAGTAEWTFISGEVTTKVAITVTDGDNGNDSEETAVITDDENTSEEATETDVADSETTAE